MKRVISLILAALLTLSLFACTGSGNEKDNMNKLVREDLGFSCYYDNSWNIAENGITVLLQAPARADGKTSETVAIKTVSFDGSADDYALYVLGGTGLEGFVVKKDADYETESGVWRNFIYVYTVGGTVYRSCNFAKKENGLLYVVTYTTAEDDYDVDIKAVSGIIKYFEFTSPVPSETSKIEYNGGRVESVNEDYRFDYPNGWGVDRHDGLISVVKSGSSASVTVQAFSLPTEKSAYGANQFWEEYEAEIAGTFRDYALIDGHAGEVYKLGKAPACRKDYSLTVDGNKYVYTQVIAIAEGYVFSMVFCGNESDHAAYLADFDSMVSSFELD